MVVLDIQGLFKRIIQKRSILILCCQSQSGDFCLVTCFVMTSEAGAVEQ